jgi:hypothetical protein
MQPAPERHSGAPYNEIKVDLHMLSTYSLQYIQFLCGECVARFVATAFSVTMILFVIVCRAFAGCCIYLYHRGYLIASAYSVRSSSVMRATVCAN